MQDHLVHFQTERALHEDPTLMAQNCRPIEGLPLAIHENRNTPNTHLMETPSEVGPLLQN